MGTTLHAHIEVKKNNKWLHFAAPNVTRNYILFAAINAERIDDLKESVRSQIRQQASIMGTTEDMSEVTAFCYEQDKKSYHVHGEGILLKNDIRNLQLHLTELEHKGLLPRRDHDLEEHIFHTYIDGGAISSHRGWDDVRIIFWYDN